MFRRTIPSYVIDSTLRYLAWSTLVLILFAWDTRTVKADVILAADVMEVWAMSNDGSLLPISARRPQSTEQPKCSIRRDDQSVLTKTRRIPVPNAIEVILDNHGLRTMVEGFGSRASKTRSRIIRGESVFSVATVTFQPLFVGRLYPAPSIEYSPPVPFELLRPPQSLT